MSLRVIITLLWLALGSTLAQSAEQTITFRVTGAYSLTLPIDVLAGATVANADDILIRFADGASVAAKVVTPEMDDLPDSFDMRLYPEYYLGLQEPQDLSTDTAQRFRSSHKELKARYPHSQPFKRRSGPYTLVGIRAENRAAIFVLSEDNLRNVLYLDFSRMEKKRINSIIEGIQ